jgi:hypothetical protein
VYKEDGLVPVDDPGEYGSLFFLPYTRKSYLVQAAFLPEEKVYLIRTPAGAFFKAKTEIFVKLFSVVNGSTVKPVNHHVYRKLQEGKSRKKNPIEPID